MSAPATPTLDKLAEHHDERAAVIDFLDWLSETQHVFLAKYQTFEGYRDPMLTLAGMNRDHLVMQWLDIDPRVVEQERRALLASLRI